MKRRALDRLLSWLSPVFAGVFLLTHVATFAATDAADDAPNAPPKLFQGKAPEAFRCQRFFTYEGKTLGCDSNVRPDGERLRPFMSDVPDAVRELNTYQHNRATIQNTAYLGSLGIALMIAGAVGGSGTGKKVLLLSGASIFGGSLIYGFSSTTANEAHLGEAIRLHNQAKPDKPIELQFSTGIGF